MEQIRISTAKWCKAFKTILWWFEPDQRRLPKRKRMKANESEWKCVKVDESGWHWINMDKSGWKWIKWMKVDENIRGSTCISDAVFLNDNSLESNSVKNMVIKRMLHIFGLSWRICPCYWWGAGWQELRPFGEHKIFLQTFRRACIYKLLPQTNCFLRFREIGQFLVKIVLVLFKGRVS